MVAGLTREQLLQRKEQLKQQEEELNAIGRLEFDLHYEVVDAYKRKRWLQTELPQPMEPIFTMLIRVEAVRRVDAEVFRTYPESPRHLHYYEVQARVLKVWTEQWDNFFAPGDQVRVEAGMTLSLLWSGIRRNEGLFLPPDVPLEEPLPCIWEQGKVYLVYELNPVPKTGIRYTETGGWLRHTTNAQDYWWIPLIANNLYVIPRFAGPKNVLHWADGAFGSSRAVLEVAGELTTRIESPPEEVLQVLDEEAAFFRLPKQRAVQLAWVRQRVLDKRLPLWKRQRALVYWFCASSASEKVEGSGEAWEQAARDASMRRRIEYLSFLRGLSEPMLQAYGLRLIWGLHQVGGWESAEQVDELLEVLGWFLAEERPVDVRRQAALVLENVVHFGSHYWLDHRDWALGLAGRLSELEERESDRVVRACLGRAWLTILHRDLDRQEEAIEKRLKALEGR
ncbi:hypothetical protein HRbin15_02684 [bacterium HR15]|nr:hypothetical protein HRbin15_02684 [bacterium HR15]